MERLTQNLNPPQAAAVTAGEGPLLVVAGPGSGKTRVITNRIAWLVAQGVEPWRIIAITFTNKAADEMRERALALVAAGSGLWVSTFHSSCARILRREIEALGYRPDFTIYDTRDRDRLLKGLLKEEGFEARDVKPAAVGRRLSHFKNRRLGPDDFPRYGSMLDTALEKAWPRYEERMRRANALDFDDLLLKTLALFERFPTVRDRWADRFRHVLVDEFQDTNTIQYEIARHLASRHGNLMVVGDPDQSIYGFRGSRVSNLLDFEEDHPGARVIRLEQNYRSTGLILTAAAGVIGHNRQRKEMRLFTENERGAPVELVTAATAEEEALRVAEKVREWLAEGIDPGQIALFYRVNARSRLLERAFQLEGLDYRLVGALSFYQRREVKDFLAWLRLVVNPADEVSFLRAVNAPPRGVGEKSRDRLLAEAARRGATPMEVAADPAGVERLPARGREGLAEMARIVAELRRDLDQEPAAEILRRAVERTGYLEWLREGHEQEEAAERYDNIMELLAAAAECDRRDPEGRLPAFLERVSLVSDQDGVESGAAVPQFMTLHTAKGLEFDAVAIVGLEDGTLPHTLSQDDEDGLEEERRLFYVGITRARKRLHLSWCGALMTGGEWSEAEGSPFLDELPGACFAAGDAGPEEEEEEEEELDLVEPPAGEGAVAGGARVRHPDYGEGRVLEVRGWSRNRRVKVDFGEAGTKILLLEYADLEVL